jgi:hypothetical protein
MSTVAKATGPEVTEVGTPIINIVLFTDLELVET